MNAHTPGPWEHRLEDTNIRLIDEENDRYIGVYAEDPGRGGSWVAVIEGDVFDSEEQLANARLIAAAPDLLEALKELLETDSDCDSNIDARCAARAAIAKANSTASIE